MGRKATDFIWQHVDRCIFLEDDQIPAVCFFQYCAELLEKYKNDMRIDRICGMNHLSQCANVLARFFAQNARLSASFFSFFLFVRPLFVLFAFFN